jgi:hypothetical protein
MAMGRRQNNGRTPGLWVATHDLPRTGGHPFYQRVNASAGFEAGRTSTIASITSRVIGDWNCDLSRVNTRRLATAC